MSLALHIPLCQNSECVPHIRQLGTIFSNLGCTIEDDTQISGRFSTQFKQNLANCAYTILHYCRSLWKKINLQGDIQKLTDEYLEKIICIDFNKSNRQSLNLTEPMDYFFYDFNVQHLVSDQDIGKFVCGIFQEWNKSQPFDTYQAQDVNLDSQITQLTKSAEAVIPETYSYYYAISQSNNLFVVLSQLYSKASKGVATQKGDFVKYPDVLGNMYMPTAYVRIEPQDPIGSYPIDFLKLKEITELREVVRHISSEDKYNISFFLNKVIPELYNTSCVVGLTIIAVGQNSIIAEKSLSMLELLIFKGELCNSSTTIEDLRSAQRLLVDSVLLHSQNQVTKNMKSFGRQITKEDSAAERLCTLIILLHLEELQKSSLADKWLDFSKFNEELRINLEKDKSNDSIQIFMETMVKITMFKKSIKDMLKESSVNELLKLSKDLLGKDLSLTLVYVFQCLKKLFETMDINIAKMFQKCFKTKSFSGEASVVADIINRGLTNFVTYCLREASHRNIHAVCVHVFKLITEKSGQQFSKERVHAQQALLFDPSPDIRKTTMQMLEKKGEYSENIDHFLVKEIELLLCPFLTLSSTVHSNTETIVNGGQFKQTTVFVTVHRPTTTDPIDDRTKQKTQKMLEILKLLDHEQIIKLFAFRLDSIPYFYVIETYSNNLQETLANRHKNHKFFAQRMLLVYLLQTCTALEYCHSRNIVHCNLTAASIFLLKEDIVKLGEFQIAVDLERSEETILGDTSLVPTRWSAPETIKSGTVSRSSDISMFGHLMYEVLSHGVLPYSHEDLTDEEYVLRVIHFLMLLNKESCFSSKLYNLMLHCTHYISFRRPNIATLISELQSSVKGATDDVKHTIYPTLQGGILKPSVNFGKGIPRSKKVYAIPLLPKVYKSHSGTLDQYKLGSFFLLKEKVHQNFSEELMREVQGGALELIVPKVDIYKSDSDSGLPNIIDIFVPSTCYGLLSSLLKNSTEYSQAHYIHITLKLAQMVQNFHKKNFVLGKMITSNLFVDITEDGDIMVYPISLAYMRYVGHSDIRNSFIEEDMYMLGQLMREVFIIPESVQPKEEPVYDFIDADSSDLNRPTNCPPSLYTVILKCVSKQPQNRPKLKEIIREIKWALDTDRHSLSLRESFLSMSSSMSSVYDSSLYSRYNSTFDTSSVMNPSELSFSISHSSLDSSSMSHLVLNRSFSSLDINILNPSDSNNSLVVKKKKSILSRFRTKLFKRKTSDNTYNQIGVDSDRHMYSSLKSLAIKSEKAKFERPLPPLPINEMSVSNYTYSYSESNLPMPCNNDTSILRNAEYINFVPVHGTLEENNVPSLGNSEDNNNVPFLLHLEDIHHASLLENSEDNGNTNLENSEVNCNTSLENTEDNVNTSLETSEDNGNKSIENTRDNGNTSLENVGDNDINSLENTENIDITILQKPEDNDITRLESSKV